MTLKQYRRLLRVASPDYAEFLETIRRYSGLAGVAKIGRCIFCRRPSGYAAIGAFSPKSRVSTRIIRWLLPLGAQKPTLTYSVCDACHSAGLRADEADHLLLWLGKLKMWSVGVTPPQDDGPWLSHEEWVTAEPYPHDPLDLIVRLKAHGEVQ